MATLKKLEEKELLSIAGREGFNQQLINKDYYLTLILYLLKDIKGIYFKGGTALQKIFFNYSRLSEDADYTVTKDVQKVEEEIKEKLLRSGLFLEMTHDKKVEAFTRLIAHYKDSNGTRGTVFIDLNKRAKLLLPPEEYDIKHYYSDLIPDFSVPTLAKKEMFAEKMAATIGRNKARDHFDLYQLIKEGLPIDLSLVKKKCKQAGEEYDIIRMFNRAKKLNKNWEQDLLPLLRTPVSFTEIIQTLAKHFKLKEEKEKRK